MRSNVLDLSFKGKKVYFASDFHLGAPNEIESKKREQKIIRWLNEISTDAEAVFLVGDIFDFWFEYKEVIPKGFIHFVAKLATLRDQGIPIYFFTGNHDLWMKDYFTKELGIPIFHEPILLHLEGRKILVGHGDGLGPGDNSYKFLKKIFTNPFFNWLFRWMHPDVGIKIAKAWSGRSRISNIKKEEGKFLGEDEWLWQYCKELETEEHHDLYIFGHRHLPLTLPVSGRSTYINLGEWVSQYTYLEISSTSYELKTFEG